MFTGIVVFWVVKIVISHWYYKKELKIKQKSFKYYNNKGLVMKVNQLWLFFHQAK